jgi:hypothetical protein
VVQQVVQVMEAAIPQGMGPYSHKLLIPDLIPEMYYILLRVNRVYKPAAQEVAVAAEVLCMIILHPFYSWLQAAAVAVDIRLLHLLAAQQLQLPEETLNREQVAPVN